MQYLPDADLHRCRTRNDVRPRSGLTLYGVDGIFAHVEARTLRDRALDLPAGGIFAAQQINAGPNATTSIATLSGSWNFRRLLATLITRFCLRTSLS